VKSQGLEPNAKSFCNMHELLYEPRFGAKCKKFLQKVSTIS
jgi:hypothetical protein